MKTASLVIVTLLLSTGTFGVQAQRRRPPSQPTTPPTSSAPGAAQAPAQTSIRRVTIRLRSGDPVSGNFIRADADVIHLELAGNNLTFKWDDVVGISTSSQDATTDSPAPAANPSSSTLSVEAALVFRSGDVRPFARKKLYLLKTHPGKALQDANVRETSSRNTMDVSDPDRMATRLGMAMVYSSLPEEQKFLEAALIALTPHIVEVVTTDFSGKALFAAAQPGSYFLLAASETPRGMVFWNLPVELKPGQNSITLDQNNAAYAR
jgi:hypothetical protein